MLGLSTRAKVVDLSSSDPADLPPKSTADDQQTTQTAQPDDAKPVSMQLPSSLSEYRLSCPSQPDKDTLLVWFLLAFTAGPKRGRCLIFVNSKSGARRLSGVLRQCPDIASHLSILHADMVQRQRLRSLERFQASESSIILATDVAARGLDFSGSSGVLL